MMVFGMFVDLILKVLLVLSLQKVIVFVEFEQMRILMIRHFVRYFVLRQNNPSEYDLDYVGPKF
jgi:hypothetical protein